MPPSTGNKFSSRIGKLQDLIYQGVPGDGPSDADPNSALAPGLSDSDSDGGTVLYKDRMKRQAESRTVPGSTQGSKSHNSERVMPSRRRSDEALGKESPRWHSKVHSQRSGSHAPSGLQTAGSQRSDIDPDETEI